MTRIMLRAHKDPFTVASPSRVYSRNLIGDNVGNLLFSTASYKLLATSDQQVRTGLLTGGKAEAERLNRTVDHVVLPLANAFRLTFKELGALSETIEHLRVPVTVLGVGAQLGLSGEVERLAPIKKDVQRFVRAVLAHGPSIGVRGEFTAAYLRSLGFDEVEIIGCPSLFMRGPHLRVEHSGTELARTSRVSLNLSPYVPNLSALVERSAATYPNLRYAAQHRAALGMLLYTNLRSSTKADQLALPTHRAHPLVAQGRTSFFVDPAPWLAYLSDFEFSFGTRIHGNIAAVLAGTPALVLAHDSRTLELVRHHAIPHRLMGEVGAKTDAAELHAAADYALFNAQAPMHFAQFAAYLKSHGLHHVYEPGENPEAFDARLRSVAFPGDVATLQARYRVRTGLARLAGR